MTSEVYPNPSEWWMCSFLFPHEAIRRMFEQGDKISEKLDPVAKPWQADLLRKWVVEFFYSYIHIHHDMEEQIYLPALAKKFEVPERFSEDHASLLALLNALKDAAEGVKTAANDQDKMKHCEEAKKLLSQIKKSMTPHLAEEERVLSPLIRDHFTPEEEGELINVIVAQMMKLGVADVDLAIVYDAILDWETPEQAQGFLKGLPFVPRTLLKMSWHPALLKKQMKWYHDLLLDEEPKVTGGRRCTIM